MTNIASECRSENIVRDPATILPDYATPSRMEFSERTTCLHVPDEGDGHPRPTDLAWIALVIGTVRRECLD
jgi:hypothetical protein